MPHSTLRDSLPVAQTCVRQSPSPNEAGKAVVTSKQSLPTLNSPYGVLIRVHAVALNPTDWKMPLYHPAPGAVIGCDFAGTIIGLGDSVAAVRGDLSLGSRVCGGVHGSNPALPHNGSFAQYLVADSRIVLRVPSGWSDAQAASLGGTGWATLGLALFSPSTGLSLPHNPANPAPASIRRTPVLVYGGATASGTMASQLLQLSGYAPITVNSLSSNDLVASYGAAASVSYTSSDAVSDLKALLADPSASYAPLKYAVDCISSDQSSSTCHASITRTGGRYAYLEYLPESSLPRKAVKSHFILGYEMFGNGIVVNDDEEGQYTRPPNEQKQRDSHVWCRIMQQLLDEDANKIRCHPPRVLEGGWSGIIEGLDMLRKGEVRGQKLVVHITDE